METWKKYLLEHSKVLLENMIPNYNRKNNLQIELTRGNLLIVKDLLESKIRRFELGGLIPQSE